MPRPSRALLAAALVLLPGRAALSDAARRPVPLAGLVAKGTRLPVAAVTRVAPIRVDGRQVALVGWCRHGGQELIAIVPPDGSPGGTRRFNDAHDAQLHEIIDLAGTARLTARRVGWSRATARGKRRPALVLGIRFQRKARPAKGLGRRRGRGRVARGDGVERWEDLLIVPLNAIRRTTLQLTVRARSADGFGGHSISSLRLERRGNRTLLRGKRQDQLDARHARCLRPEPVEVLYELEGQRFRPVPQARPGRRGPGCGGR